MIAGLKSRDYSERLKELGLTTMEDQLDMVQVYKVVNGIGVNSEQWFKMAENARETRRTGYEHSDPSSQAGDKEKRFLSQSAGSLEQCPRRDITGKDCPGFQEGLQSPPEEHGGHLMMRAMTMELDDEDDEAR